MALPAPEKERYTYADYLTWGGEERYELIYGEPVMMPGPSRRHQKVCGELFGQLFVFLKGKPCEAYYAPFDVRLFEKDGDTPEDVDTVVQPDIAVICDRNKLEDRGCRGAPDFVIEVLSPSNKKQDIAVKFQMYRRAGVREYWIVDPMDKVVQTFVLENGRYVAGDPALGGGQLPVSVLNGCIINLDDVFAE